MDRMTLYPENITADVLNDLSVELNEKQPLPYNFDLVHYETIRHKELKKHIDRFAKIFYVSHGDGSCGRS